MCADGVQHNARVLQPLSGNRIYQEFFDDHPGGGVQHAAYLVPEAEFDDPVSRLTETGYSVVQSLRLPVATVPTSPH
jgi:methylmalonyl-CoA/ethylmalonyl-CoA epimerase